MVHELYFRCAYVYYVSVGLSMHHSDVSADGRLRSWPFVMNMVSPRINVACCFWNAIRNALRTPAPFLRIITAIYKGHSLMYPVGHHSSPGFWIMIFGRSSLARGAFANCEHWDEILTLGSPLAHAMPATNLGHWSPRYLLTPVAAWPTTILTSVQAMTLIVSLIPSFFINVLF